MRTTYGAIKLRLAKVLNLGVTDARVLDYCNDAQERLLYSGKWVDSVVRYNVCVSEACLTWPRDIETIEAASVCCGPVFIRNGWYEFLQGGPGPATECSGCLGNQLIDRENRVAFDDVVGTGKKIAVYCDANEAAGAKILLRYYDSNGQKVYTTVSGAREEGEYITLPAGGGYAYTTFEVMPYGLYAVIKPATNRVIRLYEYTVAGGALKPLAYYEPDETVPVYRASLVPSMKRSGCDGEASSEECSKETITIRGKIRFIPAYNDNSILCIPYASAIRLGCQALKKEEDNLLLEAEAYWQKAYNILNQQLAHYQGDGAVQPIQVESMQPAMANMI